MVYYCSILNTNICIEKDLCLTNLSLTSSINNPYSCSDSNSLIIPFHANRKWNNNPNFIVVTLYMYPTTNKFHKYIKFINSFARSNNGKILLLVSFNFSLYKMIISTKFITKIKNKNNLLKYLHILDKGYILFTYKKNGSYCYLFYINIVQKYFSSDFLQNYHHTRNNRNYGFSGYYAAATNLYSVIPFMLNIFDYFDYYFKYDFDKPGIININEFAFNNIKPKKWYLFGTCFSLDASFICNNVKNMIIEYAVIKKCSTNIITAIKHLTNDCIQFPGWFTGMWLGLYSSIEMKEYSNFYITYKKGIKYYRWGDQQFFVNALLLFAGRNKIYYNLSYNCVLNNV